MHNALTLRPKPGEENGEDSVGVPRGPSKSDAGERIPIRGLRKRIYENMARAKRTAAHFTYVDECDVTAPCITSRTGRRHTPPNRASR